MQTNIDRVPEERVVESTHPRGETAAQGRDPESRGDPVGADGVPDPHAADAGSSMEPVLRGHLGVLLHRCRFPVRRARGLASVMTGHSLAVLGGLAVKVPRDLELLKMLFLEDAARTDDASERTCRVRAAREPEDVDFVSRCIVQAQKRVCALDIVAQAPTEETAEDPIHEVTRTHACIVVNDLRRPVGRHRANSLGDLHDVGDRGGVHHLVPRSVQTDDYTLHGPPSSRSSLPLCYLSCTEPSYPSGVSSTFSTGGYFPSASPLSSIPRPGPSGMIR